jgi:hypothetical protein
MAQDIAQWRALANVMINVGVSIKGGEFGDQLNGHKLLKNYCASWS